MSYKSTTQHKMAMKNVDLYLDNRCGMILDLGSSMLRHKTSSITCLMLDILDMRMDLELLQ